MKVLVTGGCGFIGSHFIRVIFAERPDWQVINLDALTYAGNLANTLDIQTHPRYRFVYGSITDKDLVNTLVSEVDAVINFAAETHVDRSLMDNEPFILTNILGVQRLIDACVRHGKRFHHVSTDEVFGSLGPDDPKFHEATPYDPRNPYSATKAASDHLVRAAVHSHALRGTISNCTNNYGPYLYPEKFLAIAITNLMENRPISVQGDGRQIRDWITARDHALGILAIIERGQIGHTYMMGGDAELSIAQTARAVIKAMGAHEEMLKFTQDRPGQDRRYAINYSKISTELNWKPQVTFEQGLEQMIRWYQENESWWKPIKQSSGYRKWYEENVGRLT
ncbi:MAG: dTDP-glucose 4,6-dehydratase [Candidatus Uhrbacteria bacterium GW2011_GWD2_41_121]|uniref:dTDP-glucose 4,6-dehydratase n=1 Tax=Candidatus Uhrbacteria bacterium GW2011_GWC1_41_20 TaxID=1618983 RepID=A0A0G0YHB0_9BACT|nr:MAG: dTDP-glucose 4,6-dehydratase [Candidatus Uhrbacteria bacterium GW2011_GWE1_39_46]KKR64303.1 MAG: dTDP-glucose 4,6-dehydratase [Candidatus Uhrbacteria bacterium GW2011_GWC2_40_450]KKR90473.1 MAG: dTDP-glucose 4,6-dehydratase [Candidatus Uhrbacteria bacterium GW2011_GWD2_41_121]KKR96320.1 MAG: dTDP-glucose 4,6-dehydratase [Candidatus Uhrbacteria bacterium GW2011_GWD1_41_16]KKR99737.1 MAG: dTDP-glucose 4,6-dehydratase [Candidatus Uhrbacteria bacterium GW2011_GWC1_41_20]KKS06310.1 MAG: dTD